MKYIAIFLLTFQIGFSQKLVLNDMLGKNTDTIKVGDKIKLRFYADAKLKISQFLKWDGDSTSYYFSTKVLAIENDKIMVKYKKDSLSIPLEKIDAIRKVYLGNRILSQFAVNAPIGIVSNLLLFPSVPFISFQTLGVVVVSYFIYEGLEPIIFPLRKINSNRYSLTYLDYEGKK
jgi:hypothetical protein